jgi:hypothetical protein
VELLELGVFGGENLEWSCFFIWSCVELSQTRPK